MRILTVCHDLGLAGTQRIAQNFSWPTAPATMSPSLPMPKADREQILREAGIPIFIGDAARAEAFRPDIIHIHRKGTVTRAKPHC